VSKTTTRSPRSSFPAARSFSTAIQAAPLRGGVEPLARGHFDDSTPHLVVVTVTPPLRDAEDLQDQVVA